MGLENPIHIVVLLAVVMLVFGARRLPELGHSLGSGLRGFKDALGGAQPTPAARELAQRPQQPAPAAPVAGAVGDR